MACAGFIGHILGRRLHVGWIPEPELDIDWFAKMRSKSRVQEKQTGTWEQWGWCLPHLHFNPVKTRWSNNYRIGTGKVSLPLLDNKRIPFVKYSSFVRHFSPGSHSPRCFHTYVDNYLCVLDKYIFCPLLFFLDFKGLNWGWKAARIQMHFFLIISQR